MVLQSEAMLEKNLITRLEEQGYEYIEIKDEDELNKNFRKQLEKHNKVELTDEEFSRILLHIDKGSIFKKAEILRDKYELKRTDGTIYLEFIDKEDWCHNLFQVSNQITMTGKYENRYDVIILINGIPMVQIELKRRGVELKEAFNQINRYHKHSFKGLFNYVQLFVISNGVNTKYYANNRDRSFKFSFFWADKDNRKITNLDEFTDTFLEKCHLAKMITRYIVLNHSDESLMVLRPYQFYAVEGILHKALNSNANGYIWHTTGSGKTLTSFKASQLLTMDKNVDKVIFVVDRRDLDYQTTKEFNSFCSGAVDGTENTASLARQLAGEKNKLVITTIQKLTRAIDNDRYEYKMSGLKDKKIILIFDECHRSQFGDMHKKITDFFKNIQYFGFTGTPIFSENANKFRTTKDLFGDCLHRYLIKDAISDENVLGFAVEYVGRYREKNKNQPDIEVEAIDTKELMESPERLSAISDYIINNHSAKTFNKEFTGVFAVSSIPVLSQYYDIFKSREHNLKIATIFSYGANEEDGGDEHSRDKLERYISDYNSMFGTNYSTDTFDEYYVDVAKRVKDKQIDILLVVNMFLTGFDSKYLNTLYVDKNLKYHGLVQAFSRTNRILNEKKKQGNIICFRNLKDRVDEAIKLYSDENALETVLMKSYKEYVEDFNKVLEEMKKIASEVREVDDLQSEKEKFDFVTSFRELLRLKTRLEIFTEFDFEDLNIDEDIFIDYTTKYKDLYRSTKDITKDKVSILDDVDFEIELLRRDDINVNYILNLLKDLDRKSSSFEQERKFILDMMEKDLNLSSKRDLIEKFIDKNLVNITEVNDFETEFQNFMDSEKKQAVYELIEKENLKEQKIQEVFEEYEFSGKLKKETIKSSLFTKLGLKEMRKKVDLIGNQISNIVEMFTW